MSVLPGPKSIRYKVVQGHFYHLVLSFEQSLATTAANLFEADLIDSTALGEAGNANQPEFERSSALLRKILKKIEVDKNWYDIFMILLHKVGITDLANELNAALRKEEDSSNASVLHPLQYSSPVRHSRRHSGRRLTCIEEDSGVQEDSTFITGDEVLPQQQKTITQNSVQNRQVSHSPQRTSAFVYSSPGNFPGPRSPIPAMCSSPNSEVQMVMAPSPIREHILSNISNGEAHNEVQATTHAITELNKRIKKLEEDKVKGAEEVERKGKEISEKNDIIAKLEMDYKDKDRDVKVLKKDKAKMEKKIVDLEKKSRKDIQSVHDSYHGRLQKLQENLEDYQFRERKAITELADARVALAEARLEKEMEISQLRVEFHKEKELAAQRELALREKEIATREELAEEKQKRAQDLVSRAEEEARQAKEAEMKAKEEARFANLRVQKLEAEKTDTQDQLLVPELYHKDKLNKSF